MSERAEGTHVADILIGTFVILFGLCITLVGGACTVLWGASFFPLRFGNPYGPGLGGIALLGISLLTLIAGLLCVRTGVRTATGKFSAKPTSAAGEAAAVKADDPPEA